MKKIYLISLIFLIASKLSAQVNFKYAIENISSRPNQILKKKNGNYLLTIVCIDFNQRPRVTVSKIIELNNKGKVIDSVVIGWYIDRLIALSDGSYISLGQKRRSSDLQNLFQVTRFDSKFRILKDTSVLVSDELIAPAFSIDKDSTIVFATSGGNGINHFGKIDKYGNIKAFKVNSDFREYSDNSVIIRQDSALRLFKKVCQRKKTTTFDL